MGELRTGFFVRVMALLGLAFVVALSARAEAPLPASERILQQELKQQQIRAATQKVGEQLAAIITEFERNQISGEDVKVLQAIRSVLGKLSAEEMEKEINLLREERTANGAFGSTRRAAADQEKLNQNLGALILEKAER